MRRAIGAMKAVVLLPGVAVDHAAEVAVAEVAAAAVDERLNMGES